MYSKTQRPIVVTFLQYSEGNLVWSKHISLKGTNIMIKEDYPQEIERRRKLLYPYLCAAYQGDPANPGRRVSAFLKLDKLVINNQTFYHDSLNLIPEYIRSRVTTSSSLRTTEVVTLFYTKHSPLSNFHPAPFKLDGRSYVNTEQYISYHKALLFDTPQICDEILVMTDPKMMKQKVNRTKHYDDNTWQTNAPDILK